MDEEDNCYKDYLNLLKDSELLTQIKVEKKEILFTSPITKITTGFFNEDRQLIITSDAIINLKKKSKKIDIYSTGIKRRIDITKLKGITASRKSSAFVLHGNEGEYDFYLKSEHSMEIITIIEHRYELLTGKELLFSLLSTTNLKNFVTSKSDRKKKSKLSRMSETERSDIQEYIRGDKEQLKLAQQKKEEIVIEKEQSDFNVITKKDTLSLKRKLTSIIQLPSISINSFDFICLIGKGNFGKVYLAQINTKEEMYAVKVYEKHLIIQNDFISNIMLEKDVMLFLSNPFISPLSYLFQTPERVFFVSPYYKGGDLYQLLLNSEKGKLEEEKVVFIAAQIGLALEEMHCHNIVYRNLKLENVLIDSEGYIKLVDFSKVKVLEDEEDIGTSFIGTPEYMSPEIINGEGHNTSTDWWSYGILIYELLTGSPPFQSEDLERLYELIVLCDIDIQISIASITQEAKDFLRKMLRKNDEERIGSSLGFSGLQAQPFFKSIMDWEELAQHKIKSPLLSAELTSCDLNNFDPELTSEEVCIDAFIDGYSLEKIKNNQSLFDALTQT